MPYCCELLAPIGTQQRRTVVSMPKIAWHPHAAWQPAAGSEKHRTCSRARGSLPLYAESKRRALRHQLHSDHTEPLFLLRVAWKTVVDCDALVQRHHARKTCVDAKLSQHRLEAWKLSHRAHSHVQVRSTA